MHTFWPQTCTIRNEGEQVICVHQPPPRRRYGCMWKFENPVQALASQSVIPRPAAWASHGSLLETQTLRPHPGPLGSEPAPEKLPADFCAQRRLVRGRSLKHQVPSQGHCLCFWAPQSPKHNGSVNLTESHRVHATDATSKPPLECWPERKSPRSSVRPTESEFLWMDAQGSPFLTGDLDGDRTVFIENLCRPSPTPPPLGFSLLL